MDGSPITDCEGNFYDSGGSFNRYSHGESFTTTICPDGTGGTHIQLYLIYIDLSVGDEMCFFDGPDTASPLIACTDVFPSNGPYFIEASAPNTSGCITVTFNSDNQGLGDGWEAQINCVPACQRILAELESSSPASDPIVDGWIDICPGDVVDFSARGQYPQNNQVYNQTDASSQFIWDFGDGTAGFGPNVSHTYIEPGGYTVQVKIIDNQGCESRNFISQRVRVATAPNFEFVGQIPNEICIGDTIRIENDIFETDSDILVFPNEGVFSIGGISSDSFPLPDGDGVAYENSITFGQFDPGQVVTSKNDIKSICVNIEHSYMKDIQVVLVCPSGTEVVLQEHTGSFKEVFLGEPFEGDEGNANPIPGIGYTYCWTPDAPLGEWNDEALFIDERTSLPEGDYTSHEDMNMFIGCPLNGQWTIRVEDHFALDNGWLFSWNICFSDYLIPDIETYTPASIDWGWESNPDIIYSDQEYMLTSPQEAGTASYVFVVTDEFGCDHDTTISINVLPPTHPSCIDCDEILEDFPDQVVCEGDEIMFDIIYSGLSGTSVPYQTSPNIEFGAASNPPSNPLESIIGVSGLSPGNITNATLDIASICIDIETDATEDLQIVIIAPSGETMRLATNVGNTGDDFIGTCFTPGATTPIANGTAPFTGNFMPEDPWNNLNGAFQNGDWILEVSDAFGPINKNLLKSWSITFNTENTVDYFWINSTGLSCDDCPDPTLTPTMDAQYIVRVTDGFGCEGFDTINVTVLPDLGGTMISAETNNPGEIIYTWTSIQDAVAYEVNVNGTGWVSTNNGLLSHIVSGLAVGEDIDFEVRGVTDPPDQCDVEITLLSLEYDTCLWSTAPVLISNVSCYGGSDAVIAANVFNIMGIPTYTLDGDASTTQNISQFNTVDAGYHFIVVEDERGCLDTVEFDITEPPMVSVNIDSTNALCFGGNDGSLFAEGIGGVGNFSYSWSTLPVTFDSVATMVSAGTYFVTVTDGNGCSVIGSTEVLQPDRLRLSISGMDASCNGGSDGTVSVEVTDGTAPYQYDWGDNLTQSSINVPAGTYVVTVTDDNGCTEDASITIGEPAPEMAISESTETKCADSADGTATAIPMGQAPYTYLWDDPSMQETQTAIDLGVGIYNFTITDANGCISIGSAEITSPSTLMGEAISFMADCFDAPTGEAVANANNGSPPYTYLWSDPQGQMTERATGLLAGIYMVTISDSNGCSVIAETEVTQPDEIIVITSSTPASCVEIANGSASAMASGGDDSFTVRWSNDETSTAITNLMVGIYTVTFTDSNGCTGEGSVEIVPDENSVSIETIVGENIRCFGENNGQATAFHNGGTAPYTYVWDDPLGQLSNPAINLFAGDYVLTITDDNGCTTTGNIEITEPDVFEGEIVDPINILCQGDNTGSLSVTAQGGTMPYDFEWNIPDQDSIANDIIAGNYFVTVTDANGCSFIDMASISEPDSYVEATIEQLIVACQGSSEGSAVISAEFGTGSNYDFEWSHGETGALVENLPVGDYFTTTTDENGCQTFDTITIIELDTLKANLSHRPPSCFSFGDGIVGVNSVEGGAGDGTFGSYTYKWDVTTENTELLDGLFGDSTYYLTICDAMGCSATFEEYLPQPQQISADYIKEDPSCYQFSDGSIIINDFIGDCEVANYVWSTGESNESELSGLPAGQYTVTITDDCGCEATTVIDLYDPALLASVTDGIDNECFGDENGIAMVEALGGTPPFMYEWEVGGTTNRISDLINGDYVVTITDDNGCIKVDTHAIVSPERLAADVLSEDVQCFGDGNGSIVINAIGGKQPFAYSFNDGVFLNINERNGLPAGPYTIAMRDGNGCPWDTLIQIGTPPEFIVSAGEDQFIQIGESANLEAISFNAQGTPAYVWSSEVDSTLTCDECNGPTVSPIVSSLYEVYAIDENGCVDEDFVKVFVEKNPIVVVPTAFTPNGDNNNDLLVVHGKEKSIEQISSFRVYDRWGELVHEDFNFQLNNTSNGWDGNFRSQAMQAGVYVWYLEVEFLDGSKQGFKGATTLIR